MSITIIKTQETREGVQFRLLKDDEYKFAHKNFHTYFYIKTTDYNVHMEDFYKKFTFCIENAQPVGQFTKIFLSNNFMRNKVREFWENLNCSTYEADIKANKRYLLDNNIDLNNENIPYAFYDIETDDRLPLVKDDWGSVVPHESARILSYSSVNHKGEKVGLLLEEDTDAAEIKLLTAIIADLAKYGIISGWYSKKFDMPYIKARCDLMGINYDITDFINHIDYKELFAKYDKKSRPSNSLNAISNEVLNESKIDQEKGNGAVYRTWQEDPQQLLKYNIEDSNLIYKINLKRMFIEVSMKRANNAGCHVVNTMNNSDSGDFMLMRRYKARNIIMPSEPTKAERARRQAMASISGGFTRCLMPGFYDIMDVYDQKSFYPMTVGTFNISPETYVETLGKEVQDGRDYPDYIVTPANWNEEKQRLSLNRIYKKEIGVFPELALELVAERDKIKYTMDEFKESDPDKYKQLYLEQYALKVDANSYFYGILAYAGSRYYNWQIADTITTCCQAIIKESYILLTDLGCHILGGDTDSTFVYLNGNDSEFIDRKLAEFYTKYVKRWNVPKNYLLMEHEKQVQSFLFVMKKNYAYIDGGKLKIKGLECIKSDTNPKAAELQRELIEDIVYKRIDMKHWEKKVEDLNDEVFNQKLTTKDLVLTKALTKMPSEYEGFVIAKATGEPKVKADGTLQKKSIPAHVKLASRLLEAGKDLYPGSKIHFVVIKTKPNLAISPEEFEKGTGVFITKNKKTDNLEFYFEGNYDAVYYWTRILTPFMKVIYVFNKGLPDWSWGLTTSALNKIVSKLGSEEQDDE